jgi:hypothetical protein
MIQFAEVRGRRERIEWVTRKVPMPDVSSESSSDLTKM